MSRERLAQRFRSLVVGRKIPATLEGVMEAFDCLADLVESDIAQIREEAELETVEHPDWPLPPLVDVRGRFEVVPKECSHCGRSGKVKP